MKSMHAMMHGLIENRSSHISKEPVCGWPVGDALLGEDVAAPDNACQGSASLQSGMLLSKIVARSYIIIFY